MRERVIAAQGQTPLQFLIDTMRDVEKEFPVRLDAAKAAAPYVHPKLANVQIEGNDEKPLVHTIRLIGVRAEPDAG